MSREIKFRVLDASGQMVFSGKHYDDDLGMFFGQMSPDGEDVMQYTGLKDKNGVEIYEGDIVRFYRIDEMTHRHEPRHVSSIYWANGGFQFTDKYAPNRTLASLWRPGESMEVIGNIYESPELLKEEKQ